MVPVDAAPGEVLRIDKVSEGKPVPKTTTSTQSVLSDWDYGQPRSEHDSGKSH
ncbi:hypothetical protein [Desulfurococcus mucosus]|uniref:hypothetical protein n=1 Tax=Desulfurococcus mucosus TaxID=2275 RepID=UPI000AA88BD3|nr:hypothetical protein [Desulfurococcus mucosus]